MDSKQHQKTNKLVFILAIFYYFMDMREAVRLVDDFEDNDFHTKDSCPGTVNQHKLIHIANQMQRRIFRRKSVKHLIYQEDETRKIWYKNSKCNAGIVKMGFSLSKLKMHPKAVSMEHYALLFLGPKDRDENSTQFGAEWLSQNDYVLVTQL